MSSQKEPLFNKHKSRISLMNGSSDSTNQTEHDVVGKLVKEMNRPVPPPKATATSPKGKQRKRAVSCPSPKGNYGTQRKSKEAYSKLQNDAKKIQKNIASSIKQRAHMNNSSFKPKSSPSLEKTPKELTPKMGIGVKGKKNDLEQLTCQKDVNVKTKKSQEHSSVINVKTKKSQEHSSVINVKTKKSQEHSSVINVKTKNEVHRSVSVSTKPNRYGFEEMLQQPTVLAHSKKPLQKHTRKPSKTDSMSEAHSVERSKLPKSSKKPSRTDSMLEANSTRRTLPKSSTKSLVKEIVVEPNEANKFKKRYKRVKPIQTDSDSDEELIDMHKNSKQRKLHEMKTSVHDVAPCSRPPVPTTDSSCSPVKELLQEESSELLLKSLTSPKDPARNKSLPVLFEAKPPEVPSVNNTQTHTTNVPSTGDTDTDMYVVPTGDTDTDIYVVPTGKTTKINEVQTLPHHPKTTAMPSKLTSNAIVVDLELPPIKDVEIIDISSDEDDVIFVESVENKVISESSTLPMRSSESSTLPMGNSASSTLPMVSSASSTLPMVSSTSTLPMAPVEILFKKKVQSPVTVNTMINVPRCNPESTLKLYSRLREANS